MIKDEIVKFFNEAIKSYNKIVSIKEFPEYKSNVDDFNSVNQFYSAMETAFREVITNELGITCPRNLHEMVSLLIENLSPGPLENGIDLFYILRYKDTRNQAVHNLNIEEQNPYPRLFLNGQRFIKTYIDRDAKIEKWNSINKKFDYADFKQKFKTNRYDHVRVLVVGPMHDYDKEQLKLLTNFHWNIVLDFDPYSSEGGLRSIFPSSNTQVIQLSQIERMDKSTLSLDTVTWLNCDGDHSLGIDSFSPLNDRNHMPFMPAMVEGSKNWRNCVNLNESRKNAHKLIREFFEAYFTKMAYSTDIVFLMDYSQPIMTSIVQAVEDNLDNITQFCNVFFIDESMSEKLKVEAVNNENWSIYSSTIYNFANCIERNEPIKTEINQSIMIPYDLDSGDGIVSERAYHKINKNFYLLHKKFPSQVDEPLFNEDEYDKELYNFSRGEEVKWNIVSKDQIAQFDIFQSALKKVESNITKGNNISEIYHAAGFGGTTLSRHIAYRISDTYPVLYMKSYDKNAIEEQLKRVYSISRKRVIIFIEEKLFNNKSIEKDECIRVADATTIPYTIIFIGRRAQEAHLGNKPVFLRRLIKSDIEKLLEFNKRILSVYSSGVNRRLLRASADDFIRKLGEENCSPFLINLSIYEDKYIKIDEYVNEYVTKITAKPSLVKVFVYLSIFSKFINEGIPTNFVCNILQIDSKNSSNIINELVKQFDPIIYIKHNEEFKTREIALRAPIIATVLLKKILMNNSNEVGYRSKLSSNLKSMIKDFKVYYDQKQYANKRLRQLFIDKSDEESIEEESISNEGIQSDIIKKFFAPVIAELWDKDNVEEAGNVFICLTEEYSEDPYFCAHTARFYAYTNRSFPKAREYADKALSLSALDTDKNIATDIYHVKGMCIRTELFNELDLIQKEENQDSKHSLESIYSLVEESANAFSDTLNYANGSINKSIEYACSAWLKMMMRMLSVMDLYKLVDSRKAQEYIETAERLIEELEDIYVLRENQKGIADLQRKKAVLISYRQDVGKALADWNNFYNNSKNQYLYVNCLYSCRHRYYLLEHKLNNFKSASGNEAQKKINALVEDFKYSLLNISIDDLKVSDLATYISLVRFSTEKVATVSSLINSLYIKGEKKPDIKVLFYRYVLKFISAYHGDRLALQETIDYMKECKLHAERIAWKTNSVEFFRQGREMDSLISKKFLLKVYPELKNKIYESEELGVLKGRLKSDGSKSVIIPFDNNGKPLNGIEVFVNLKYNPHINSTDSGQEVSFKMGFSYDGLRAENMSVRPAEKDIGESAYPGSIVKLNVIKSLKGKNGNITALIGSVGKDEPCILHISNVGDQKILPKEMKQLYHYARSNPLQVSLIRKSSKGWVASLSKAGILIDKLLK